ncbi:hypothetical protein MaudCBS49596_003579 [Microsporum audouinii]
MSYTFSGEIITIRTTPEEYYRLLHAFDATATESEKRMLILLRFDKDFATTTIRNEQVILHQRVISGILWQLRDFVKRESIEKSIFCAGDEISPELPIPDL